MPQKMHNLLCKRVCYLSAAALYKDTSMTGPCLLSGPVPHNNELVGINIGHPGLHRVELQKLHLQQAKSESCLTGWRPDIDHVIA